MAVTSEFEKIVRSHRPRYHARMMYNQEPPIETQSYRFWENEQYGPIWGSIVPQKSESSTRWDVRIDAKRKRDLEHALTELLRICGLPETVQEGSEMRTIVKSLAYWGRQHGTKVGLIPYAIGCLERGYMVETGPRPPKARYIA